MFNQYGTKQVYLVQPVKLDYEISCNDPIELVKHKRFRSYKVCDSKGCAGGMRIQLNRSQAENFAIYNGLKLISEDEQFSILDSY